jgi:hypothetical protein
MKQSPANGKYILENELRTWSDLKRRAAAANTASEAPVTSSPSKGNVNSSPTIPARRWGGCASGCNHDKVNWPRRAMRKNTMEYLGSSALPPASVAPTTLDGEKDDHPIASQEADHTPAIAEPTPKIARKASMKAHIPTLPETPASPNDASNDSSTSDEGGGSSDVDEKTGTASRSQQKSAPRTAAIMRHLHPPPNSSRSGRVMTPAEGFSDDSDYFPGMKHAHLHQTHTHGFTHTSPAKAGSGTNGKPRLRASSKQRQQSKERKLARRMSEKNWKEESGMGTGARADTLGDGDDSSDDEPLAEQQTGSPTRLTEEEKEKPILREALKGDMIVEHSEGERGDGKEDAKILDSNTNVEAEDVDRLKEEERKGFGEVY